MKLAAVLMFACLLPSVAFAVTQQDCTNQVTQCVTSACTQAGCQLSGTDCSCTPAEEAQWNSLIDSQCQPQYYSCLQSVSSGGSPTGGSTGSTGGTTSSGGGCCGAFVLLPAAGMGLLLARKF